MRKQIIALFYALAAALSLAVSPFAYATDCPLCKPALDGDIAEIKRLLTAGADVNAMNDSGYNSGRTALMLAQKPEVVKLLLDAGAYVNAVNGNGWTALVYAWNSEIVQLLLDAGADANLILVKAVKADNIYAIKKMLRYGVNPDAADEGSDTALIAAVQSNNDKMARILLDAGADPSARGEHGLTALYYAEKNGNAILLRWLKEADSFWWKIKKRFSSL